MNPSALQPRPPRKSLFFALAETIVRALLPENPSHKEDTHAPTNHQAFYPLVAKWLTETKAELTAAIYFPLLGLRRIPPQQDFRMIRRRTTKQLYAITLEMIIEEGEGVVIDDPRYSGALKMFFAVFLRKEEGNIAETIVPQRCTKYYVN